MDGTVADVVLDIRREHGSRPSPLPLAVRLGDGLEHAGKDVFGMSPCSLFNFLLKNEERPGVR